jgi:hypothetical protein
MEYILLKKLILNSSIHKYFYYETLYKNNVTNNASVIIYSFLITIYAWINYTFMFIYVII